MKKFLIIIIWLNLGFISTSFAQIQYQNSLPLKILNTTGKPGFFGTCVGKIAPNSDTLCSTPQPIKKGTQTILVPPYQNSFPVFSTNDNNHFTCATLKKPDDQLSFSIQDIRTNILILESLIPDKNGKNVAVLCGLQKKR